MNIFIDILFALMIEISIKDLKGENLHYSRFECYGISWGCNIYSYLFPRKKCLDINVISSNQIVI